MGSIYKRGRVWWISYYRNGRQFLESSKTDKKTVADRLLKQREGSIAEGKMPGVYADRVRFEELVADLLNDYNVNGKRSAAKAEQRVRLHLEPFFRSMRATQITTANVRAYITRRLNEGASNATVNRELAALKRAFNLAAKGKRISRDNVPDIPMLEENNTRTGFFEHEEFLTLRDALPEHLKGFVTFGYKTGCRFGEICGLKWGAVDRKEGIIRLEGAETKNKEGRLIPLDREVQDIICERAFNRHLGCDYVFHMNGHCIVDIRGAWKAACKAAGCEGMLFHDLRRSAVRNMIRAGISEQVAMRISGHKTRSVFQRYNIIDDDDLKRAAFQQEAYLQGK
jgi:integrase